ncbi:MAG: GGDEF domain-containing protein, partial [Burkholderiaceae bacterium]|nr:GGDEF domain-containing protein [Burkholderiaceae bacterium]
MSDTSATAYEALVEFLYRAPIGLVQTTLDGAITMINPMSAQLLMPLAPDGDLLNLFDVLATAAPQLREIASGPHESGGVICDGMRLSFADTTPEGGTPLTLALSLLKIDSNTLMASLSDVTLVVQKEQQRLTRKLNDASRIDGLTKMPTRAVVVERINAALQRAHDDPDYQFAVLFINADRFNRINVTLGQAKGDELILEISGRLNGTIRQRDSVGTSTYTTSTAGRLSGDEFVVVLEGVRRAEDVERIAQRLVDTLNKPYRIGDQVVHATCSMGVVMRTHAAASADTVLQDASLAMREAKTSGGARFRVFVPLMKERAWRRGNLEAALRLALNE